MKVQQLCQLRFGLLHMQPMQVDAPPRSRVRIVLVEDCVRGARVRRPAQRQEPQCHKRHGSSGDREWGCPATRRQDVHDKSTKAPRFACIKVTDSKFPLSCHERKICVGNGAGLRNKERQQRALALRVPFSSFPTDPFVCFRGLLHVDCAHVAVVPRLLAANIPRRLYGEQDVSTQVRDPPCSRLLPTLPTIPPSPLPPPAPFPPPPRVLSM